MVDEHPLPPRARGAEPRQPEVRGRGPCAPRPPRAPPGVSRRGRQERPEGSAVTGPAPQSTRAIRAVVRASGEGVGAGGA